MGRGKGGGNVRDILLGPSRYKTAKREKTRWENYLKTLERHFGKRPDAMFETPEGSPRLLDHITRLNLFNYLNHIYTDTPEQELNHFLLIQK